MKKLSKLATICGIVLGSLLPLKKAEAQITGNIGYTHSENDSTSLVEAQAFYELPKKIDGFTFLDFYKKGSYFGKTYLGKNISPRINYFFSHIR